MQSSQDRLRSKRCIATYTTQEALHLLGVDESFLSDILDSEGESDIEEDPSFPLPREDSERESEEEAINNSVDGKFQDS